MRTLFLIGAGGHCKSCIDVIEAEGRFRIAGLIDRPERVGEKVLDYEIVGSDGDLQRFTNPDHFFLMTLGQIKTPELRMKLARQVDSLGGQWATVVSPRAYVSRSAQIDGGSIVMHDALINAGARVGRHGIINTKALVEHDAVVEDFCHISTGAILNGDVHMKAGSFLGSQAVTEQGLVIPERSLLSAGLFHRRRS